MKAWYVVFAHPREEGVALENLVRQGFETYWPTYRKTVTHARKVREISTSLFPRYLFTRFDTHEPGWHVIRSTRGVVGLVRNGLYPAMVPQRLIDEIRSREDDKGDVLLSNQIELKKGQKFHLKGDAFKGHELIFEAKKDSDRVIALLSLLGREFKVEVPLDNVIPAAVA